MDSFVNFVLGEVQYLNVEGLVRIVGLAIILEFIPMVSRALNSSVR